MLKIKVLCVSMLLLFITMPAHGQSSSAGSDTWQFEVSPYIFLPAVEGDTTVNGQTMPLDLSFGDIFDNFDVFGLSGRVRARKGKWGIIFDVATLSLETDVILNNSIPPATAGINLDIRDTVVDLGVSYRVVETEVGGKRLWIEPLVGVRYHYLKQEIGINIDFTFPPLPPAGTVLGGSEEWFEPFVGGIIGLALTEKFTLLLRGDAAGFGIEDASDLTWNIVAGFDYRFSQRASFKCSYRFQGIDYETGTGAERFAADLELNGPMLGLTFYF